MTSQWWIIIMKFSFGQFEGPSSIFKPKVWPIFSFCGQKLSFAKMLILAWNSHMAYVSLSFLRCTSPGYLWSSVSDINKSNVSKDTRQHLKQGHIRLSMICSISYFIWTLRYIQKNYFSCSPESEIWTSE